MVQFVVHWIGRCALKPHGIEPFAGPDGARFLLLEEDRVRPTLYFTPKGRTQISGAAWQAWSRVVSTGHRCQRRKQVDLADRFIAHRPFGNGSSSHDQRNLVRSSMGARRKTRGTVPPNSVVPERKPVVRSVDYHRVPVEPEPLKCRKNAPYPVVDQADLAEVVPKRLNIVRQEQRTLELLAQAAFHHAQPKPVEHPA